jgi:hypothetical protein
MKQKKAMTAYACYRMQLLKHKLFVLGSITMDVSTRDSPRVETVEKMLWLYVAFLCFLKAGLPFQS